MISPAMSVNNKATAKLRFKSVIHSHIAQGGTGEVGVLGRFGLGATSMQYRQGKGSGRISVLVMAAKEGFLGQRGN